MVTNETQRKKKMRTHSEAASRIRSLREALQLDQRAFARSLGQARSLVSACESGKKSPSVETYARLGSLAAVRGRPGEAAWFWQQIGIDSTQVLSVAGRAVQERRRSSASRDVVLVAPLPEIESRADELLPLPARLIDNPGSTSYLRIDRNTRSFGFGDGDIIVLDTSHNDILSVSDETALIEYRPEEDGPALWLIGRLDVHTSMVDRREWVTEIVPVADVRHLMLGSAPVIATYKSKVGGARRIEADQAKSEMKIDSRYRIRGRVVAWFRREGNSGSKSNA